MVYRLSNGVLRKAGITGETGTRIVLTDASHLRRDARWLPERVRTLNIDKMLQQTQVIVEGDCLFGALHTPRTERLTRGGDAFFYVSSDCVAIISAVEDDVAQTMESIAQGTVGKVTIARFLCQYFERRLANETNALEKLEDRISRLEEMMLDGNMQNFPRRMSPIRRDLRKLHTYYERVADIVDALVDDENDLFEEESARYFRQFGDYVKRLIDDVQMLRDYALQVQQMYQAQIDNRQNNIMRVLTVITTIFFPLSLITSWYGMNFAGMKELEWEFGYPLVIVISAVIVVVSVVVFRRKRYL